MSKLLEPQSQPWEDEEQQLMWLGCYIRNERLQVQTTLCAHLGLGIQKFAK